MKMATEDSAWLEKQLLERFIAYAKIHTTSDDHSPSKPTTQGQWDLLDLLVKEMTDGGVEVLVDPKGYVIGRLESNLPAGQSAPSVAFLAHVDTAQDAPGDHVKPIVHKAYDGGRITLPAGPVLDPVENPALAHYKGQTIITSDGSTLLGADDKAGVAGLMTACAFLQAHPQVPHGPVEFIFTTDEEVGRGTEDFPFSQIRSRFAYTLDGSEEGSFEAECYNAYRTRVDFTGVSIHPGTARGRLVNAASMALSYAALIPRSESPEATDGRFGCLWIHEMQGSIEKAFLEIRIRDFDHVQVKRRLEMLEKFAASTEAAFPGGTAAVTHQVQYLNMKEKIDQHPKLTAYLESAIRSVGLVPWQESIRGGTDGARLTELGLPTPNIFTGGMNYHSRTEWLALPALVNATKVVIELVRLWGQSEA